MALAGREEVGCASGSGGGGGRWMIKLGKAMREMLERAYLSLLPSDTTPGQNATEGMRRKSYPEVMIEG